jgi:hypothetical protein
VSGEPEPQVTVYLTNATRTSQGPGPGPKVLPAAEASALVAARLATYGSTAPRGFSDGGLDGRTVAAMMPRRVEGG